ncbi:MAG: histidine kinase [Ruthenibacterium sp.]
MQQGIFRFKIYRQKLIAAIAVVLVLSVLLFASIAAFLIQAWAKEQQEAAATSFTEIEESIGAANQLVNDYLIRLYANRSLTTDMFSLLSSDSEQEYLEKRRENSEKSSQLIASFPSDVRAFLLNRTNYIAGVSITTPQTGALLYLNARGDLEMRFHTKDSRLLQKNYMSQKLVTTRLLYDPNKITTRVGELHFWFDPDTLLHVQNTEFRGTAVAASGQVIYPVFHVQNNTKVWAHTAMQQPSDRGSFREGFLNRVYYGRLASSQADFQVISMIDSKALRHIHAGTILFLCIALVLAMAVVLAFVITNMWLDARFLSRILTTIGQVERGKFKTEAELPRKTQTEHENEYGLISAALDNMSVVLGNYIHTEYQLKLKQQEAKMRALQNQINPHFLYNTLEAIRTQALVAQDLRTADAIALLGGLYRDVVRGERVLSVQKELDLLETYLKIMQLRYPDIFCYQFEIEPEILQMQTVKFWMQPLAENFFAHGFDRTSEYNLLLVIGSIRNGCVCIDFVDNGKGVEPQKLAQINASIMGTGEETGFSIGLRNVYSRLAFFYGENFSMQIQNNPEGGACIAIQFPKKEESSECISF